MKKKHELADPTSCLSRAKDNEILFILLERDDAAPETIRFWINTRIGMGKNKAGDNQMVEAERCANAMEDNRKAEAAIKERIAMAVHETLVLLTHHNESAETVRKRFGITPELINKWVRTP